MIKALLVQVHPKIRRRKNLLQRKKLLSPENLKSLDNPKNHKRLKRKQRRALRAVAAVRVVHLVHPQAVPHRAARVQAAALKKR